VYAVREMLYSAQSIVNEMCDALLCGRGRDCCCTAPLTEYPVLNYFEAHISDATYYGVRSTPLRYERLLCSVAHTRSVRPRLTINGVAWVAALHPYRKAPWLVTWKREYHVCRNKYPHRVRKSPGMRLTVLSPHTDLSSSRA
jgi:hypothetical protein